jgi:hypothetical protein
MPISKTAVQVGPESAAEDPPESAVEDPHQVEGALLLPQSAENSMRAVEQHKPL